MPHAAFLTTISFSTGVVERIGLSAKGSAFAAIRDAAALSGILGLDKKFRFKQSIDVFDNICSNR